MIFVENWGTRSPFRPPSSCVVSGAIVHCYLFLQSVLDLTLGMDAREEKSKHEQHDKELIHAPP